MSRKIRVYDGAVESLSDAGSRGIGHPGLRRRALPATRTAPTSARRGSARWPRPPTPPPRWQTRTSSPACPRRPAPAAVADLASPEMAEWTTERKVELALAVERAARAREGVSQVERRGLLGRRGARRDRQLARLLRVLPRHPGLGLRLGLRRRGRGPHDRHRDRPGPRSRRARPRGHRRRGGGPGARPHGRAPAREPQLPRRARRVRRGLVRRASSARCSRRTRSSAAARCSPAARARRWPSRRSCSSTTGAHPDGPASRAVRRRGLAHPPHAPDRGRASWPAISTTPEPPARTIARPRRTRAAAPTARPPSVGTTNLLIEPGDATLEELVAAGGGRALRDRRGRAALRREPGVRHLLGRRLGAPDRGWRAGGPRCARSPSPATSSAMLRAVADVGLREPLGARSAEASRPLRC